MQLLAVDKQNFITVGSHGNIRGGLGQKVRKRNKGRGKKLGAEEQISVETWVMSGRKS